MRTLKIELHSEWRSGTGRGKGVYVDAESRRDRLGLPMIPGKQLKGLIRHALITGADWGHWDEGLVEQLCGSPPGASTANRFDTSPGRLSISSARMSREWLEYFRVLNQGGEEGRAEAIKSAQHFFRVKRQTKIDDKGLVQNKSLRSVEVCVPMTLYAQVDGELSDEELRTLSKALKLIKSVGGMTTRGLGRATLTLGGGA